MAQARPARSKPIRATPPIEPALRRPALRPPIRHAIRLRGPRSLSDGGAAARRTTTPIRTRTTGTIRPYARGAPTMRTSRSTPPPQQRRICRAGITAAARRDGDDGYDDPPRREPRQQPGHRRRPDRLRHARHRRCLWLPHLRPRSGSKQAPVIIADSSPSKIVPAAEQKSARSQDRIGGQGRDERLVSREEQPVALQPPGTSAVPRVVFPSPVPAVADHDRHHAAAGIRMPSRLRPTEAGPHRAASVPRAAIPAGGRPARRRRAPPRPGGADRGDHDAPPAACARASRDQPLSLDPARRRRQRARASAAAGAVRRRRRVRPPRPRPGSGRRAACRR